MQGTIVSDNINVAGLALDKHVFGVALVESVEFTSETTKFDGLMGLAKSILSNQGVLTPVESLAQQGLISEAITPQAVQALKPKIARLTKEMLDPLLARVGWT